MQNYNTTLIENYLLESNSRTCYSLVIRSQDFVQRFTNTNFRILFTKGPSYFVLPAIFNFNKSQYDTFSLIFYLVETLFCIYNRNGSFENDRVIHIKEPIKFGNFYAIT